MQSAANGSYPEIMLTIFKNAPDIIAAYGRYILIVMLKADEHIFLPVKQIQPPVCGAYPDIMFIVFYHSCYCVITQTIFVQLMVPYMNKLIFLRIKYIYS